MYISIVESLLYALLNLYHVAKTPRTAYANLSIFKSSLGHVTLSHPTHISIMSSKAWNDFCENIRDQMPIELRLLHLAVLVEEPGKRPTSTRDKS